jgi:LmbE family N-acetylglucosaminyl deacetylase
MAGGIGDDFLSCQRVLVISPHADDETYGCAGTMARVKARGGQVYVLLISVGSLDHYASTSDGPSMRTVSGETRLREFSQVMKLLKVDDWEVVYTDNAVHLALDAIPRRELVRLIERDSRLAIEKVRPTLVLIPAFSYNQDHEALFRACITATRPGVRSERHLVPFVLAYDNTSLFWSLEREKFHPNFYVDITDYLSIKLEALRLHASQIREPEFHGSPESLELISRLRGREISADSAEGFMTLRAIF